MSAEAQAFVFGLELKQTNYELIMKKYIALVTLALMCSCQWLPFKPSDNKDSEIKPLRAETELALEDDPIPILNIA